MNFLPFSPHEIQALLLVFGRLGGIMMTAPVFSSPRVPMYIRAGVSIMLAVLLQPLVSPGGVPVSDSLWLFGMLLLKEVLVGLVLGYAANLIFSITTMAGDLQDTQAGFGLAGVVDPNMMHNSAILGQFQMVLMWLIFFAVDGHHVLLEGVADSFLIAPVGVFTFSGEMAGHMFRTAGTLLLLAVKISAPIVAAVLLTDLALGLLQRTVPQLNLIAVGFQAKIAVAVSVLLITLPFVIGMDRNLVPFMQRLMHEFMILGR